jgi:hypothetical protein
MSLEVPQSSVQVSRKFWVTGFWGWGRVLNFLWTGLVRCFMCLCLSYHFLLKETVQRRLRWVLKSRVPIQIIVRRKACRC